jgi:predicted lactoylglutathione lyase
MDFYRKLGFEFNGKFTDENVARTIVSDFMLLTPPHFARFSKRKRSVHVPVELLRPRRPSLGGDLDGSEGR